MSNIGESISQDVGFSQFYANQLYLNPAFAGSTETTRVFLGWRNQYPGTPNTYVTYFASIDRDFDLLEGGLGFYLMNDAQANGVINKTSANGIYSYRFEVGRDMIFYAGFQVSYVFKSLNSANFIFGDMIDITGQTNNPTQEQISDKSKGYLDFATGFLASYNNYYGGVAAHHLTQPNESYNNFNDVPLPIKYTAHFGAEFPIFYSRLRKLTTTLSPNILYQKQREFSQINYGLYITYLQLTIGAWLRQDLKFNYDSFIFLLGYSYKGYNVSYSYDLSVSGVQINNKNLGTHEVTFSMDLEYNSKRKKIRAIKCPKF